MKKAIYMLVFVLLSIGAHAGLFDRIKSEIKLKEEEKSVTKERRTFDMNLAILILAFSLPFSTILVMGILSSGQFFVDVTNLIILSLVLIGLGLAPHLGKKLKAYLRLTGKPNLLRIGFMKYF